ncbi:hypothetical protein IWQ62_000131 [Dispira parvispora]|uniref:pyridoxal kinase n=1 Tax=Dispira parvispora TaxID=1520584 RepID=A0A9W8B205_9FUNG|nr:hypothetical protein IWQ62_000131 [Dispira parvispora]
MKRILSIQSHVVSGYVGNKAATFPLQLLGYDVDAINTVQFSNHTGYNHCKGERTPSSTVVDLYEGLKLNGLDNYTSLLTGYMGNPESIEVVAHILTQLRESNPELFYVLDPVLGDDGQLYVHKDMIELYKQKLLPYANLITPNQFETELLTGTTIRTQDDVLQAMDQLHALGVDHVVMTSAELTGLAPNTTAAGDHAPRLHLFGSQRLPTSVNDPDACATYQRFRIDFPKLQGYFTGTGDLCCALLLAHLPQTMDDSIQDSLAVPGHLAQACEQVIATMAAIMGRTLAAQQAAGIEFQPNLPRSQRPSELVRYCELKLIQSRNEILAPVVQHRATIL